jgi:hypothetical protein
MRMVIRLASVMALLLAAAAAQAQNKIPSESALEALVRTTLLFLRTTPTSNPTLRDAALAPLLGVR